MKDIFIGLLKGEYPVTQIGLTFVGAVIGTSYPSFAWLGLLLMIIGFPFFIQLGLIAVKGFLFIGTILLVAAATFGFLIAVFNEPKIVFNDIWTIHDLFMAISLIASVPFFMMFYNNARVKL